MTWDAGVGASSLWEAATVGKPWPHLAQIGRVERRRTLRRHWGIENKVNWVRDVTSDEDRSQVRTGAAPQVMAACRNIALNLLRRSGATNIAAALRTQAGRPATAVQLVLCGGFTG
jgi:hypothetical protein